MRRVIIESPFAGDRERNLAYLREAILDSLARGEAPFASHAIYPQFLDDNVPELRRFGIEAGFAWWQPDIPVIFYTDLGWSPGMSNAYHRAKDRCLETIERSIR